MPSAAQPKPSGVPNREAVWQRYTEVRGESERLAAPLATEDYVVQAMPDVSPPKWHLAHISWFFENFIAAPHAPVRERGWVAPLYWERIDGEWWRRASSVLD